MKFFRIVTVILLLMGSFKAFAQPSAELKKQREQLNRELEKLNSDLAETSKNKKSTLRQLELIQAQIAIRVDKISNINSSIRLLDNQISENTNTVHSLQNQLQQLKKQYAAMVLFAFRNKSAYNKLMFVFVAKDFNQAYKRLKYMQQIGAYRERQARFISGTQKDLNQKIVELDKNKEEKNGLLLDQVKEKETLGQEKNSQAKVANDLTKHQREVKDQIATAQRKKKAFDKAIAIAVRREIAEARRKAEEDEKLAASKAAKADGRVVTSTARRPARTTSEILTATPEAAKLSADFMGNRGRLPWPVANGAVTRGYGTYFIEGIKDDNKGWNIKTDNNAAIRAVFEGEVTTVVDVSGSYLVIIRHGGYFTVYKNLRTVSVSKGQKVSTKQNIGTAAVDPSSGDPEIGFEVYKGEADMNPKTWLAPSS